VLSLGYQTLMNRTGQQGDADLGGSGGFENIDIQVAPFLNDAKVNSAGSGHRSPASTPVLLRFWW